MLPIKSFMRRLKGMRVNRFRSGDSLTTKVLCRAVVRPVAPVRPDMTEVPAVEASSVVIEPDLAEVPASEGGPGVRLDDGFGLGVLGLTSW